MAADRRLRAIRGAVSELAGLEGEVAERLERARRRSSRQPDALAAIQRLLPIVRKQRGRLVTYLGDIGKNGPGEVTARPQPVSGKAAALSAELRELCLAFHRCALGSAMVYEAALRLYEPRLREMAAEHLKAHTEAALSVAQLLPGAVATQLARDGLACACVCPMCGVGACGCVDLGTETLVGAWRGAVPAAVAPPRFVLQPPRPDSALGRAGVQGGDLVLAVDGRPVHGRQDIQDALRSHSPGDEVRILVRHGSEASRELVVRHAGDYPKG